MAQMGKIFRRGARMNRYCVRNERSGTGLASSLPNVNLYYLSRTFVSEKDGKRRRESVVVLRDKSRSLMRMIRVRCLVVFGRRVNRIIL